MSRSKKRTKEFYKFRKLIKSLEQKIVMNSLFGDPIKHFQYSLSAAQRVYLKRKERTAEFRRLKEEKRKERLNEKNQNINDAGLFR